MCDEDISTLRELLAETKEAGEEVAKIMARFDALKRKLTNKESSDDNSAELLQNVKLRHRIAILERSIEEEKAKQIVNLGSTGKGLQDLLSSIFVSAITKAFPELQDVNSSLTVSTRPQFGDYQCNAAMSIANALKSKGEKVPPREVANKILQHWQPSNVVEKAEVAGAGFINIWINKSFCLDQLKKIVTEGVKPPLLEKKERVVIDFSSPNIAKEMHVGHLRSTIIGDSIARLLEYLGHDVKRLNHVGDWGTQFGMLIAHLQDQFPDYLKTAPPISDLQAFYKESKARFDSDADFKNRAYSCVVKLQSYDPDYIKAWNLICEVSRREFQVIYDRLNIKLEERGESFYQKLMEEVVQDLESRGLLEEDEGRKILFGNTNEIPLTIVKSDGGFTYDTSDMAAIRQRIYDEKASWIIYVTDAGQATHFKVIISCAEKVGYLNPKKVRVDHVAFGVVLGEDKKKFKTRSGETIRLNDLLEEGLKRAESKLKEKNRDDVLTEVEFQTAKTAVAFGCIKYADLSHNRMNDYIFSFDKMLEDKGNTAVYLLYALTRIRSIRRNANVSEEQVSLAASGSLSLDHEKEYKLIKVLLRFNDVLIKITKDLLLHHLCEYLYEVATTFTEFYDVCYVIERDPKTNEITKVHMNRLVLCEATALIMEKCFNILGIQTVSRM